MQIEWKAKGAVPYLLGHRKHGNELAEPPCTDLTFEITGAGGGRRRHNPAAALGPATAEDGGGDQG